MTSPDLPAELKAALDAKLRGFSRNDAAERSASISKTYRDGGGSGAIRTETDALAYALARMPATYAAVTASLNALCRNPPGLCAKNPARYRRRAGHGELGRGGSIFLAARLHAARRQRRAAQAGARPRQREFSPARTQLRTRRGPQLPDQGRSRRPRRRQLRDRRTQRSRTERARRADVGKDPRYAAGGRTRHAGRLCADHRAARAPDRGRRACRRALPARRNMSACTRRTGAISPSACSARARTSRSRAPSCRSRTKNSPMWR